MLSTILGSSLIGGIVGAGAKAIWDRRAAKKTPKTDMRAEAYRDFIVYVVQSAAASRPEFPSTPETGAKYHDIAARLLLFGESEAVHAAAKFSNHSSLTTPEALQDFGALVAAMRKSLLTSHSPEVIESAKIIARSRPWV